MTKAQELRTAIVAAHREGKRDLRILVGLRFRVLLEAELKNIDKIPIASGVLANRKGMQENQDAFCSFDGAWLVESRTVQPGEFKIETWPTTPTAPCNP